MQDEYKEMVDAYFRGKAEEYASILEWANKPIDFMPQGSKHKMHISDSLGCGLSSDKKTVVHINEIALYEQCGSPHRDNPDFWIIHGKAGNPFIEIDPHGPEEVPDF